MLSQSVVFLLQALSADAHEVIPMYNSSVAKHYSKEQRTATSQREWTCDSFYDGHSPSYTKPTRNNKSRTLHY